MWPDSGRPLRVEAAALGGRPVAFMLDRRHGRSRGAWPTSPVSGDNGYVICCSCSTASSSSSAPALLARKNLREGRGDRARCGASGRCMTAVLLALWVCQVHVVASLDVLGDVSARRLHVGVLRRAALDHLRRARAVRPPPLAAGAGVMDQRADRPRRDPVVGRDVLIGVALGIWFALIFRGIALRTR